MASADSHITPPEEPGSIMCSVLNLIFDHSMEDPTPMEPEEYRFKQQNPKSPLKVPVIRIFGPLLRDPRSRPLQSACLHIHGAFPYLLARPVIAGPDGSLRRALPVDGQVNWDDPVSVELIVKPLQSILEDAIQALDMKRILGDAQDFAGTSKPRENLPVIRKITVVQGRGFFTYCPGPPAPFLKVEYYDPKLRWKVKLMLERGLQVPLAYFPDPAQYDQEVTDENPDALRFNCYEAHIPYSMQFFKDWNLAGMSYLHIQQGKIRPALRESLLVKYRAEPFDSNRDGPAVFLRFNTPLRYLWMPSEADCRDHDGYYHDPSFPPPPKATNSDVEIDCSVYDLRNVDDVLKTLPSAEEERDKIQWRAVPSLQEIWRQERRRMAKLLTPEKDFLTPHPAPTMETPCQKVPPPFTLNVKQGSERSGSRLACKGMRSLVRLTHGLEEEFERSLHQILKRHQHAIQQVDRELLNPPKKAMSKETPAKATKCGCDEDPGTPSFDEAADALSSLAVATGPKTPSLVDAMNALESLYRGVDDLEAPQSTDTPRGALNRNDQDVIMEDENTRLQFTPSQQSQTSVVLSYPSSQELHDESDKKAFSDPAFLSQRVDRGDSIFHDEGTVHDTFEECIDPKTLLPYDHLDFGVNRCRVQFTVDTDPAGIRRICGNPRASCRRDGHSGQSNDDRVPPGCYKTISTGIFVDGIFEATNAAYNDEEDSGAFEKALDVMRAAIPNTQAPTDDGLADKGPAIGHDRRKYADLTQDWHIRDEIDHPPSPLGPDRAIDNSESESDSPKYPSTSEGGGIMAPVLARSRHIKLPDSYPAWVSPVMRPPSRRAVSSTPNGGLHPTSSTTDCVPIWLVENSGNISNHACMSSSQSLRPSSYVQPTRSPPTRRSMVQWWKRTDVGTVHQANQESNQPVLNVGPRSLEIDANSRKIVAFAHGDSEITKSAGSMTTPNRDVEVAVWEPSQAWQLSMTQQSQGEGIDSRLEPRTDQKMVVEESQFAESTPGSNSQASSRDALEGIGAQGGKIHVEGGGTLKTRTRATPRTPDSKTEKHISTSSAEVSEEYSSTPISFMSVEIHVQCRTGVSRLDSKRISMAPDSSKDKIFAIVYLYGIDPGGGESLQVLERCCLFLKFDQESTERTILAKATEASMPRSNLGMTAPLHVECLDSEKKLLLRFSSLVTAKDPDMLMSWDTQSAGLGYMIERALVLNNDVSPKNQRSDQTPTKKSAIDLVRLLGRTPFTCSSAFSVDENEVSLADTNEEQKHWKFKGSGLGVDWDERVGAGAAAASIVGRLVFAGWKIVAEEVKHPNSSYLPAVTAAVLNKRIPQHDDLVLTQWYASRSERWRVLHHRVNQAMATLLIFDALDIVGRAGEAARLSGVEFSQSFPGIRGSQYKVEGVLLRALQSLRSDERGSKEGKKILTSPRLDVGHSNPTGSSEISRDFRSQSQSPWKIRRGVNETKPSSENRHYFFYSPSKEDCDRQEALEVQALTLEPESGHYTDPVVVCDFTALYPSLVIAYNLCYSTCAGKLEYHSTRGEMQIEGKTTGRLGPFSYHERRTATVLYHHFKSIEGQTFPNETSKIEKKRDRGYIAPTGTLYVAEDALKGVLPQVLDEILTTRAMLKRASKEYKKNVKNLSPAVLRQLEARQLALKYVANVTYGYTSATFSGRCAMPLLADTIVECGRKTLRKAINMANCWGREEKWKGAKVIYGDTDSLFVQLPGRSYKEAFDFGEELCKAVTADNPPPVQLKLEKVYLGSIMQTMKRYCGMKFESRNDRKPSFEAKGLETVRRDQCALTQKVLRNALITLFRHGIDAVRDFLNRQWYLINAGHIPMSDFVLTGRVRSQYRGGREGPVQAVLAQRLAEADPGHTTRNKERIPYVIVATPGKKFKLKDCVLTPVEMLERWDGYTIHSAYYIERHVNPALARCLSLAPHHIDMNAWYRACPKPRRRFHFWPVRSKSRTTIDMHFGSDRCVLCEQRCKVNGRAKVVVCPKCREDHIRSAQMALSNLNQVQHEANELAKECSRCNGCFEDAESFASLVDCDSSDRKRKTIMSMVDGTLSDEHLKIPLANCVCIDCPNTFKRHHLRGQLIERTGTCEVLGLF